jgi:hypothetical protein
VLATKYTELTIMSIRGEKKLSTRKNGRGRRGIEDERKISTKVPDNKLQSPRIELCEKKHRYIKRTRG